MRLSFLFSYLPLSVGALLCLTSCDEVCEKDEQPQLHLTASQRDWANPYEKSATWRFRNAAGYERSYLIKEFKDDMMGAGGGKSSLCPRFYYQFLEIQFERTDSVQLALSRFTMTASANHRDLTFGSSFFWGGNSFGLPITEVDAGVAPVNYGGGSSYRILPQFTAGSRVYQNVIESTLTPVISGSLLPSTVLRVFVTKTEGIIRFETKAGTA